MCPTTNSDAPRLEGGNLSTESSIMRFHLPSADFAGPSCPAGLADCPHSDWNLTGKALMTKFVTITSVFKPLLSEEYVMRVVYRGDLDGIVCTALLIEVGLCDEATQAHPKDMQDQKIDITENDILCNLHITYPNQSSSSSIVISTLGLSRSMFLDAAMNIICASLSYNIPSKASITAFK